MSRTTHIKLICLFGLLIITASALTTGCGKKNTDPSTSAGTTTTTSSACGTFSDIATAIEKLDTTRPSWDTIRAWAAKMSRLTLPSYRKALNVLPGKFGDRDFTSAQHSNYWATVVSQYSTNMSAAANAGPISPPHVDSSGTTLTYPYSGSSLDEKLRAQSTLLLCEKARGYPVIFGIQYHSSGFAQFASISTFNSWITSSYLPMVVEMAKAAEIIKAEFLDPFPSEAESFINRFGQPNLNVGTATLISTLNTWLNNTKEAIRPTGGTSLFTGKLVGRSYANYETGGYNDGLGGTTADGSFWTQANFTNYDELHVTLSSNCSTTYLSNQLAKSQAVAVSAGSIPWYISEVWITNSGFLACGGITSNPAETYLSSLFTKIDALSGTKPLGVGIDINPEDDNNNLNSTALTTVTNYFAGKAFAISSSGGFSLRNEK